LIPSDPDVETIVGRIADGSIDLQPDFQRGSVWSRPKQRLLIDSILRGWYVPPVHVVRTSDDTQVVLDGQQRLRSIYEFCEQRFTVDGKAEPFSTDIELLDGLYYKELPQQIRRRFDRFTVRVFEVVDYSTEEPWELFYRLNQPTPLTAAEKRNAFFGPARAQIRELASFAEDVGMTHERLGFSNARLAYEDVIARFVWTLEIGTLDEKVTANRVTERYREPRSFDDVTMALARDTLLRFLGLPSLARPDMRLNRAMLHSWLCFVARGLLANQTLGALDSFVPDVEIGRLSIKGASEFGDRPTKDAGSYTLAYGILNDRATSRVNDVSSVLLRDSVLWSLYCLWQDCQFDAPQQFIEVLLANSPVGDAEYRLLSIIGDTHWSSLR
jgi:hypothetical protein